MRKIICFFLLYEIVLGLSSIYAQEDSLDSLNKKLQEIQKQWQFDWRLDVFEWNVITEAGQKTLAGKTTIPEAENAVHELLQEEFPNWKDDFILLPEENKDLNGRFYGIVTFSVINLYYAPDYAAELGTQALLGMPIRIVDRASNPGWIRIQMPNGYLGYTTSGSVVAMNKNEYNQWTESPKIVWTDFSGFVYSEPNEESPTVSDVVAGNMFRLENADNERFYRVSFPDGRSGWLAKQSSMPFDQWIASRDFSADNITQTARKFLGFPYFWAGTSTKGVDCSGLVATVMFLNRTIVLRDASQQMRDGINIDISNGYENLQPGDLLYFGKPKSATNLGITHTGIYLGDSEFIHCATSVRINSLDPERNNYFGSRTSRLVKATRLTGSPYSKTFMPIEENSFYQPIP